MIRGIGFLGLSLLASACRREAPVAPPATSSTVTVTTADSGSVSVVTQTTSGDVTVTMPPTVPIGEYKVAAGGGQSITVGDVHFETADDLPERTSSVSTTVSGNNQVVMVLRGWQIVVNEGRLLVAGRDFGPVPGGSRVRLAKDGVHVGDELRGPLP